jgi:hypothetical protein
MYLEINEQKYTLHPSLFTSTSAMLLGDLFSISPFKFQRFSKLSPDIPYNLSIAFSLAL